MPRPTGIYGINEPYLAATGQALYDTPAASLPPITRALRQAWNGPTPVASADFAAAALVAVNALETRLAALEGH